MFVLRIVLPGGLVALAFSTYGGGVFGWLDMPLWAEIIVSLIILDFVIYAQHVALHRIAFLWQCTPPTCGADAGCQFGSAVSSGRGFGQSGRESRGRAGAWRSSGHCYYFRDSAQRTSLFTHTNLDLGRWDARLQALFVSPDIPPPPFARRG